MTIHLYHNDIPADLNLGALIAADCEMMGLQPYRDRLCLLQLSSGDGDAHLVKFDGKDYSAPNLKKMLADKAVQKIFHFARTDLAVLHHWVGVRVENVFCTKIASRLCRTYTDHHSLKTVLKELLGVEMSKAQQCSDWGVEILTPEQMEYAASDVLHLHALREKLLALMTRDGRLDLAQACFDFLPYRAELDLGGWSDELLSHH